MTFPIDSKKVRNKGSEAGIDLDNAMHQASMDIKLVDMFAKFVKKADEATQASL